MAVAREYTKTALVIGILSTLEEKHNVLLEKLEKAFGPICKVSPVMPFPYTDYYDKEMSGHPVRYLILFDTLVSPDKLADIKTETNRIEKEFADGNGRRINIDPGTLSLANFILATCKDRSHRVALSKGIFAEVTMIYQDHDFQTLPWTYADYSSDDIRAILRDFRDIYKSKL